MFEEADSELQTFVVLLEMARLISNDRTVDSLKWQFRRHKAGGRLQSRAAQAGRDPVGVNVNIDPPDKPSSSKASSGHIFFYLLLLGRLYINTAFGDDGIDEKYRDQQILPRSNSL